MRSERGMRLTGEETLIKKVHATEMRYSCARKFNCDMPLLDFQFIMGYTTVHFKVTCSLYALSALHWSANIYKEKVKHNQRCMTYAHEYVFWVSNSDYANDRCVLQTYQQSIVSRRPLSMKNKQIRDTKCGMKMCKGNALGIFVMFWNNEK